MCTVHVAYIRYVVNDFFTQFGKYPSEEDIRARVCPSDDVIIDTAGGKQN